MEKHGLTGYLRKKNIPTLALANMIVMAAGAKAADTDDAAPAQPAKSAAPSAPSGKKPSLASTDAASATAKPDANGVTRLKEVVVTAKAENPYQVTDSANGKYTMPLLDTPQSITVVPQALIKDQNASSLRDVLQNVPGVTFGAGEGATEAGDNITIRGFNAQEDIFVDGFRDTGVYNRDPFNLQQVEVVKGPASAYSGHGSTGGYVNLITKSPTMDPLYEFNTSYGTDQYYRETLDIDQPLGIIPDAALRLNAVYQSNNFADLDQVYNSRWGANPVLGFGLGTDTVLKIGYLFLQEQDLPSFGLPTINANAQASNPNLTGDFGHVAPVDYSNFYGFANRDYENTTTHIPTVTLHHDFDPDLSVDNIARYDYTLRQSIITAPRFDVITGSTPTYLPPGFTKLPNGLLPEGLMTREMKARHQLDTLAGDQASVNAKFDTFHLEHSLFAAAEYSHQEEDTRTANGANVATNLSDPNANDPYPFSTQVLGPKTRAGLDDAAFSMFDAITITPQWILSGGMRYDHLEENTHIDQSLTGTTPVTPSQTLRRKDDLASWRTALNYKPVENGTIYFGYGTSYNPSIEGGQDAATADGLAVNTVNLPPEENQTMEVGTKWNLLNDGLSLDAAFFRDDKTNARITDPSSPAGTTVFALAGKQRVEGFDFSVQGNLTREWKIFGGYTYMQSTILSGPPSSFPGNHLPNTPNQSASAWSTYELPCHLTLGGGVNFMDKRYGSVNNTTVADGYWTGQLMAAYKINKHFNVQVNVYNLWDTRYIAAVGSNFEPGPGRSVVFSAEVEY